MTMPIDVYFVRHGESERNFANRVAYGGDESFFTKEFIERPTSLARLTVEGQEQARAAGVWLRENAKLRREEDRYYCSSYVRAAETAALLGLPEAKWRRLNRLRERSAGDWEHIPSMSRKQLLLQYPVRHYELDPYNWPPPNGETLAYVEDRLIPFFDTLHRECSERKVVVVCHGEVLMVIRVMLERMTDEEFRRVYGSRNPHDRTHNGVIIHYSRRDPVSGNLEHHLNWMRIVCPWDTSLSPNEWTPIVRKEFSNKELLGLVEVHPRMLKAS